MSVRHLTAVADVTGLPPTCKLLLYAMAVSADPRGYAVTATKTMIRLTGLSERSIRDNLAVLKKLGLVEKKSGSFHKIDLAALGVYNPATAAIGAPVDHDPGHAVQ